MYSKLCTELCAENLLDKEENALKWGIIVCACVGAKRAADQAMQQDPG